MYAPTPPIICIFFLFFLLFTPVFPIQDVKNIEAKYKSYNSSTESKKMKLINDLLKKINKPFVKSIKSPDGDIIDCVLIHLQPAFDLPQLKGSLPLDPPELPIPNGHEQAEKESEIKQVWSSNGESCPNGTIPIRRTTASDILSSSSISNFGKKIRPDSLATHEYAVGTVGEGVYHGAKGVFNFWKPNVTGVNEFSLSQMWLEYNVPNRLLNTIEAGWMVYPDLFKDNGSPRLFNYWTPDDYKTGCYNLLCPGFVQTTNKYSLGGVLHPLSTYDGTQYIISIFIFKAKTGDWWLHMGDTVIGYWPSSLFPDLCNNATDVHYGGEVISNIDLKHTSTQMGSGHFPEEGYKKAAYIRNLEVVDIEYSLKPASNLKLVNTDSNCYAVTSGFGEKWGNYIYFGGPGNNPKCP
ncbi:hypothetical protein CTI12_AA586510 [Artemisia annua]|uniref:Neprosin PEP catalytic domain-containing protein n=1 Tax=Artemisia annua TaxID=35608 RepID=A0A2U1KM72_ARTAN|nr:hypothetical protein CTI12_AA586510 [Artemisia annua]